MTAIPGRADVAEAEAIISEISLSTEEISSHDLDFLERVHDQIIRRYYVTTAELERLREILKRTRKGAV